MPAHFQWTLDAYLMLAVALALVAGASFTVVWLIRDRFAGASFRPAEAPPLELSNAVASAASAAEAALRRFDPSFTADRLAAHVRAIFETLSARPLDDVRPWLSDGLYQRLLTQERLGGAALVRGLYATHALAAVQLASSDADAAYQSVRARLSFSPRAPAAAAGAGRTQELRLLRRLGAKTPAAGLLEGKCPHCGAPLKLAATGRCSFCEAVVNSGAHDWVLIEITEGTAAMHRKADAQDFAALRAQDPALSADELEDRAALAFWRWHEARVTGDGSRLPSSATETFCAAFEKEPRADRAWVGGAAFELLALARGDDAEQQADVVARWVERDAEGAHAHRRAVLRLRRRSDALTPTPRGLATARCAQCLAPLPESAGASCAFCQATFDSGWRLDAIVDWEAWFSWFTLQRTKSAAAPAPSRLAQLPSADKELILETLAAISRADGAITEPERALLHRAATVLDVAPSLIDRALGAGGPPPALSRGRLRRDQARLALEWLVDLTTSDGRADARERRLLERIAKELGETEALERLLNARLRQIVERSRPD